MGRDEGEGECKVKRIIRLYGKDYFRDEDVDEKEQEEKVRRRVEKWELL